jgi:hypothetical protein
VFVAYSMVKGAVDDLDRVLDILTEMEYTEDRCGFLLDNSRVLHAGQGTEGGGRTHL